MNTVEKITKLIKERGMQQKEFANIMGLKESAVSAWKKGDYAPSLETITKIADYFGVTTDYLLRDGEQQNFSLIKSKEKEKMPRTVIFKRAMFVYFGGKPNDSFDAEVENLEKQGAKNVLDFKILLEDISNKTGIDIERLEDFYAQIFCPTLEEFEIMLDALPQKREEKACMLYLEELKKDDYKKLKKDVTDLKMNMATKDDIAELKNLIVAQLSKHQEHRG